MQSSHGPVQRTGDVWAAVPRATNRNFAAKERAFRGSKGDYDSSVAITRHQVGKMQSNISNLTAIVATVALLACIAFDLRHNIYRIMTGRTVVLVSVFLWYLLEALVVPNDLAAMTTQGEYDAGLLFVAVGVMAFLATYHSISIPLFGPLARRLPYLNEPRVIWPLLLGCLMIGFGGLLLYLDFNVLAFFEGLTGMAARWDQTLSRGRYGSWRTILYELQMFLQAAVPLAVALAFMKHAGIGKRVFAGLFVAWISVRTFTSGTRSTLLPIILCVSAAVVWNATPRVRRWLIVGGVPCALLAGYFVSAIIVLGRNEGKFDVNAATEAEYVGFEMFRELLFVARSSQEGRLSPQLGVTYFTQLVNPIPRAIWPDKPVADAVLILARAYGAVGPDGEPLMTISPGFLGEAYLNFGMVGLLIVPGLAGLIVRAWDRMFRIATSALPPFLIYAAGLATIFASGRSFNFSTFYGLLSLFLLLVVFETLGLTRTKSQRKRPAEMTQLRLPAS